jgi:hypothetical protein
MAAGGYGKTTLARAICHEERVQNAFDDGILSVTLGEQPGDVQSHVVDLIEVLTAGVMDSLFLFARSRASLLMHPGGGHREDLVRRIAPRAAEAAQPS